MKLRIILDT